MQGVRPESPAGDGMSPKGPLPTDMLINEVVETLKGMGMQKCGSVADQATQLRNLMSLGGLDGPKETLESDPNLVRPSAGKALLVFVVDMSLIPSIMPDPIVLQLFDQALSKFLDGLSGGPAKEVVRSIRASLLLSESSDSDVNSPTQRYTEDHKMRATRSRGRRKTVGNLTQRSGLIHKIETELGASLKLPKNGTFNEVYRATISCEGSEKTVAVKILLDDFVGLADKIYAHVFEEAEVLRKVFTGEIGIADFLSLTDSGSVIEESIANKRLILPFYPTVVNEANPDLKIAKIVMDALLSAWEAGTHVLPDFRASNFAVVEGQPVVFDFREEPLGSSREPGDEFISILDSWKMSSSQRDQIFGRVLNIESSNPLIQNVQTHLRTLL
ncbi:MAG: hypothetical protein ACI9BD_000342 [Candidatus Marinamargulisbacteria bacterium]|jgi:hypothetical protein